MLERDRDPKLPRQELRYSPCRILQILQAIPARDDRRFPVRLEKSFININSSEHRRLMTTSDVSSHISSKRVSLQGRVSEQPTRLVAWEGERVHQPRESSAGCPDVCEVHRKKASKKKRKETTVRIPHVQGMRNTTFDLGREAVYAFILSQNKKARCM